MRAWSGGELAIILKEAEPVLLNYGCAAGIDGKLLRNLSGVAEAGGLL
ncbi:hypothetical protein [Roseomonas elaeocarpi]|uniref:Uncharacterized protein n=1 Tax=Roseomonas elaeocarpi TaxID=907779 RepID=A0ABV6JN45_9PROT